MLDIININIYDYAFKECIEKQTHKHRNYNIGHKKKYKQVSQIKNKAATILLWEINESI